MTNVPHFFKRLPNGKFVGDEGLSLGTFTSRHHGLVRLISSGFTWLRNLKLNRESAAIGEETSPDHSWIDRTSGNVRFRLSSRLFRMFWLLEPLNSRSLSLDYNWCIYCYIRILVIDEWEWIHYFLCSVFANYSVEFHPLGFLKTKWNTLLRLQCFGYVGEYGCWDFGKWNVLPTEHNISASAPGKIRCQFLAHFHRIPDGACNSNSSVFNL